MIAAPEKAKPGRKPLAAGEGKTARVQMKVRPDQKAAWQAKADAAGLALQVWIEHQCDSATTIRAAAAKAAAARAKREKVK